ncbi:hypothetical protein HD806DRAFT_495526 [Xylariaceae sp. AK1471]|nr:hypothetical protein HD806DRAFT_495526 [Xylariaceae sp. AK1471]
MQGVRKTDTDVNRHWEEPDEVMTATLDQLIPRLLDPLTAEGRSIKPRLIHGDLWEANIGTDVQTGRHTSSTYVRIMRVTRRSWV